MAHAGIFPENETFGAGQNGNPTLVADDAGTLTELRRDGGR
jgi:hypothetical protein